MRRPTALIGLILVVLLNDAAVLVAAVRQDGGSWTLHCPPTPFDWTHDPDRLQDLGGCRYVEGIVLRVDDSQSGDDGSGHGDGDLRITLQPGLSWANLGRPSNDPPNSLYLEVVPAYRKHGVGSGVTAGDRIEAVGTYAADTIHNYWAELHPTTWVKIEP